MSHVDVWSAHHRSAGREAMWPRAEGGERKKRARKREREGAVIFSVVSAALAGPVEGRMALEFGSGASHQGMWLWRLGCSARPRTRLTSPRAPIERR